VHPDWVGCTAVVCCVLRNMLVVANAGDSRAVLCRGGKAIDMSEDHKPNLPAEKARIERNGGEVKFDGGFNYRVYAKGKRYPGLNMSRSIGDLLGHRDCGLIPTPDVTEVVLTSRDAFLVLCSDGVWKFMTVSDVLQNIENIQHISSTCIFSPSFLGWLRTKVCILLLLENLSWW